MQAITTPVRLDVHQLAAETRASVDGYGARPKVLPPDIARARTTDAKGALAARCDVIVMPRIGDLRVLEVTGPEARVLGVVSVPRPDHDASALFLEVLLREDHEPVARLQVSAMVPDGDGGSAAQRVLSRASQSVLGTLQPEGDTLDLSAFSEAPSCIADAFRMAWSQHIYEMVVAPTLSMQASDDHFSRLKEWRNEVAERMHFRSMLSESFGAAWTQRVLRKHLLP